MSDGIPIRIQRQRIKGWRMPPNTIIVDRSTRWGNPFSRHSKGIARDNALAVGLFEDQIASAGGWVSSKFGLTTISMACEVLRGHNLACWCPLDQPCHADVLLRLVNEKFLCHTT
jgi:hypothetical protein